jgi:hypothetical protein
MMWLAAAPGGTIVVQTAKHIRYVYPVWGTKFRRRAPFMRVSRTGYDQRNLSAYMIVGTAVIGGKKFESCEVQ